MLLLQLLLLSVLLQLPLVLQQLLLMLHCQHLLLLLRRRDEGKKSKLTQSDFPVLTEKMLSGDNDVT